MATKFKRILKCGKKGSATLEFITILPLVIFMCLFVWQLIVAGMAVFETQWVLKEGVRIAASSGSTKEAENKARSAFHASDYYSLDSYKVKILYVGIRYREFVQQESFRPKTKIGKVIVSIGVLSSVGAGFAGYNIGKSEGAETFFVIVCPIFACLFTLFFNSALKQIEDQVEEQKQQQS
ncbi:hypothetical protein ACFQ49_10340 [Kroppenstedtia eburnea]|uniref:hypothetical protein n=1 Tax=Kroppenstedtia eburnea TaxID=714067 RepID=UPI00362798F8